MANDLLKNTTRTYYPYLPALDATPYVPARGPWRERISTKVCSVETIPEVLEAVHKVEKIRSPVYDMDTGTITGYATFEVHSTSYRVKVPARQITTCTTDVTFIDHPAQPAQEAFPGRKEQFATTLTDYHLGWEASAQSIASVLYGGYGEFNMPLVTGVIVGLSTAATSANADYTTIGHALYFGNGTYKIMERGAEMSADFPFAAGDRFRISRTLGQVAYLQNDAVVFTSERESFGPMRLDAAIYSGADQINNPLLKEVGDPEPLPPASGSAEVRPPMAAGSDGTLVAWGRAEVRVEARGAMQPYIETPKYSAGIAMSYAPIASGMILSGGVLSSGEVPVIHPVIARGYDHAYAAGSAESAGPMAFGYMEPAVPVPTARLPKLRVSGRITVFRGGARPIRLPALRASGRLGLMAKLKLPKIKASGSLAVTTVMRAELMLPAITATGRLDVGPVGQAKLRLPAIRATGRMGGVGHLRLSAFRAHGEMTVGGVGTGHMRLPSIRAHGELVVGAVMRLTAQLPAILSGRAMVFRIVLPAIRAVHKATSQPTLTAGEAYCTNLRTEIEGGGNELTRFTEFPFLRVLRFNGRYYGLASDGLHRIEGDKDADAPIRWLVSTGTTDFGQRELKHIPSVYVGGRLGPGASFKVHEGEKRDFTYPYTTPRGQTAQNYRQHFGKGLRARYYSFTLSGTGEFELDGLHFEVAASKRRL